MRSLTFKTYLKKYVTELSESNSLSVHKLVKSLNKNYRLLDSLLLYCVFFDKKDLFNKYTKNKYETLIKDLTTENYLDDKYKDRDFSKIYDSYLHKINTINYDFLTKDSIRNNILKIMKEKKITNYRLYTDLKINHGNVNDYLKNANCRKVSLELVEKMFNYVINY